MTVGVVGMYTAVRFGRVPKREKAKILEQMQRVNVQCHGSLVDSIIADEVGYTGTNYRPTLGDVNFG